MTFLDCKDTVFLKRNNLFPQKNGKKKIFSYFLAQFRNKQYLCTILEIIVIVLRLIIRDAPSPVKDRGVFYALYSSIPIKLPKSSTKNQTHTKFMINCTFQSPKHLHKLQ